MKPDRLLRQLQIVLLLSVLAAVTAVLTRASDPDRAVDVPPLAR
jgi:hypothetical protein